MGPTTGLGVRRGDYVKQEVLLRKFSQNSYQGISLACRYIYIYISKVRSARLVRHLIYDSAIKYIAITAKQVHKLNSSPRSTSDIDQCKTKKIIQ